MTIKLLKGQFLQKQFKELILIVRYFPMLLLGNYELPFIQTACQNSISGDI